MLELTDNNQRHSVLNWLRSFWLIFLYFFIWRIVFLSDVSSSSSSNNSNTSVFSALFSDLTYSPPLFKILLAAFAPFTVLWNAFLSVCVQCKLIGLLTCGCCEALNNVSHNISCCIINSYTKYNKSENKNKNKKIKSHTRNIRMYIILKRWQMYPE